MIVIDLQSSIPIEEQIRSAIREVIALGRLVEGDTLPSVRQLAGDLSVHFNTVARAYRKLQEEGLLLVGQGRGVFVKNVHHTAPSQRKTRDILGARLHEFFADARLLGLSKTQTTEFVLAELERWTAKEKRP